MKIIFASILIAAAAMGATRVTGIINGSDGRPMTTYFTIDWPGFTTAGGQVIVGGSRTIVANNGTVDVTLAPTIGATPSGVGYTVRFAGGKSEIWSIPDATSARLTSVRSLALPVPSVTVSFADGETPSGLVDGVNRIFVLSRPPVPASSLVLHWNGLALRAGDDYTIVGSIITTVTAPAPSDVLLVWYRW